MGEISSSSNTLNGYIDLKSESERKDLKTLILLLFILLISVIVFGGILTVILYGKYVHLRDNRGDRSRKV